jgi:hypothetical protein
MTEDDRQAVALARAARLRSLAVFGTPMRLRDVSYAAFRSMLADCGAGLEA